MTDENLIERARGFAEWWDEGSQNGDEIYGLVRMVDGPDGRVPEERIVSASFLRQLADALESTLAELRQERERADVAEDELDQALAKRISVTLRDVMDARAALSRAEETIDRIDTALRGDGRSSVLVVGAQGIITEYREQKEADR